MEGGKNDFMQIGMEDGSNSTAGFIDLPASRVQFTGQERNSRFQDNFTRRLDRRSDGWQYDPIGAI